MIDLIKHNEDRNNLSLADTNHLLAVETMLETNAPATALAMLREFIAGRGYDELPLDRNGEEL